MVTGREEFYAPTWSDWRSYGPTLEVGIVLFGLIHVPRFRAAFWELLKLAGQTLRLIFFDSFRWFFGLPLVQRIAAQPGDPASSSATFSSRWCRRSSSGRSCLAAWPIGR